MGNGNVDLKWAGWLYLALAAIAPFSLSYVPLVIAEANGAFSERLATHQQLLHLSMASVMLYQIIEVFIVLALFNYFRSVNSNLARQMLVLGLLPLPIIFLNELNLIGAISFATGDSIAAGLDAGFVGSMAALFYDFHETGIVIASIFWGLWLIPLGRLVIISDKIPKFFGYSVMVGAAGYIISAAAILVLPSLIAPAIIDNLTFTGSLLMLGEVPIIAGLLWTAYKR